MVLMGGGTGGGGAVPVATPSGESLLSSTG